MLTESLALSAAGGVVGAMLAVVAVPVAAALVPTTLPIAEVPTADLRMLGLAAVATLATGVGFGLVPAWRVARAPSGGELRHGTRVFGTQGTERLRGLFVVGEVAAAIVLLVTVGLFLKALWQVQEIDPGFDARGVVTVRTALPLPKYEPVAVREQFYRRVLDDVLALPGVESAAYTSFLPLVMGGGIWPVLLPGTTVPEDARTASVRFVTPGYFATMRVPIVRGRDVADTDRQDTQYVAVVSRAVRGAVLAGPGSAGATLLDGAAGARGGRRGRRRPRARARARERTAGLSALAAGARRRPRVLRAERPGGARVRTALSSIVPVVRAAVARADPEQPVSDVRLMTDIVERQTSSRATQVAVLLAFAAVALLLALVGIHSLLAYVVAARTPEIGVRIALGATRGQVLALVWRRAATLAALGAGVGLVVAYAVSRSVQALLAGISAADVATYVTAVGGRRRHHAARHGAAGVAGDARRPGDGDAHRVGVPGATV